MSLYLYFILRETNIFIYLEIYQRCT